MNVDGDFPAHAVDRSGIAAAMEAAIEALGAASELMELDLLGCRELAHSVPQLPMVMRRIEEAALFFRTTAKFLDFAVLRAKAGLDRTTDVH